MRNARPSLFIFAVLSAVLRSGFRDTRLQPKLKDSVWPFNARSKVPTG